MVGYIQREFLAKFMPGFALLTFVECKMTQNVKCQQFVAPGRNCENCLHSVFDKGDASVGIWEHYDCNNQSESFPWRVYFTFGTLLDVMPTLCGHYEPILLDKCTQCGTNMGVPANLWALYHRGDYVNSHVCSPKCYLAAEVEYNADLERQDREFQEWLDSHYPSRLD